MQCLTRDGVFGNPSSMHRHGRLARERVERARAQAAALIHAEPQQLVWTSGATESNNLAILGTARAAAKRGRHLITARTEHKSVLDPCHRLEHEGFKITYLDTDSEGLIDAAAACARRCEPTRCWCRSCTPTTKSACCRTSRRSPRSVTSAMCRCTWMRRRAPARWRSTSRACTVDLLSFTAHKLYGPKGDWRAVRRAGAARLAAAADLRRRPRARPALRHARRCTRSRASALPANWPRPRGSTDAEHLRAAARAAVARPGAHRRACCSTVMPTRRVAGILNVSFAGIEGESLLMGLTELVGVDRFGLHLRQR